MQYEQAKELSAPEFKRLFGVQRHTLAQMLEVIGQSAQLKKQSGSPQLSLEDQVLVAWQYWRYSPHLLSHCSGLGRVGIDGVWSRVEGRNHIDSLGQISLTWKKVTAPRTSC